VVVVPVGVTSTGYSPEPPPDMFHG
jgi:hypothetical protein